MAKFRRSEIGLALATALAVVALGVLWGIAAAIALIDTTRRSSSPNATDLVARALSAVDEADPPAHWFVLDAEANINLDLTAADALEELRVRLTDRGIVFATTHLRTELRTP